MEPCLLYSLSYTLIHLDLIIQILADSSQAQYAREC
uniref:Uncharacterized protein n=1 Tax=Setaria italica TaxID=4555 RepID=K3Y412_SETIT